MEFRCRCPGCFYEVPEGFYTCRLNADGEDGLCNPCREIAAKKKDDPVNA